MSQVGFLIGKGALHQTELRLYDISTLIPKPVGELPYVLLERIPVSSTAQAVTIAHRRGAVPITEKE